MVNSVRHAFTVHDYAWMRITGMPSENAWAELIDGAVRVMSPIEPLHVALVNRLTALLTQVLTTAPGTWVQNPVQLNDYHTTGRRVACHDDCTGARGCGKNRIQTLARYDNSGPYACGAFRLLLHRC